MGKTIIGKVSATEKNPNTVHEFHFWTDVKIILKPFDVVVVEHISSVKSKKKSKTFAVVEDIFHVTDTPSFLSSYISSDFGDTDVKSFSSRVGFNYIKAKVTGNNQNIFNPVQDGAKVRLANREEIIEAYGLQNVKNPVCAGYFEMYEDIGEKEKEIVPVNLDREDLIGPEAAHLNISGISGLATKTSYVTFLIKNLQDLHNRGDLGDEVSYIVFNVKGQDLLHLDESSKDPIFAKQKDIYKKLGLECTPMTNVHYYYPYSNRDNMQKVQTSCEKDALKKQLAEKRAKRFVFTYEDSRQLIELLLTGQEDNTGTIESILHEIEENPQFDVHEWDSFKNEIRNRCEKGSAANKDIQISSWKKFSRLIRKSIKNDIFQPNLKGSKNIQEEIRLISSGDIYVIDISYLDDATQAFVFGAVLRTVNEICLEGSESKESDNSPNRIVMFMDELNKFAPKEAKPQKSPILQNILDVTERGRSLGMVLFGAEQFKSAIHERVTGNTANNVYGRTNDIEASKHKYLPKVYKRIMTRLPQGQLLIESPKFRQVMQIKFPFPPYHQPK
jgi:uncharacterized protein